MSTSFTQRSPKELAELSIPSRPDEARGVYYLLHQGVVVYIGSSMFCPQRVEQHIFQREKVFDAFHIELLGDPALDHLVIEAEEIMRLQPELNRTLPTNRKYINSNALKRLYNIGKQELNRRERREGLRGLRFKDGAWYYREDIAQHFGLAEVAL